MSKPVDFKFDLGTQVKDTLTGFEGIILARAEYLTGCHHYGVQPRQLDKEGKRPDWEWIDATYLEAVEDEPRFKSDKKAGGSAPNPPRA